MAEKNIGDNIKVTKQALEDLGEQIKSLIQGVKANIEDYRFSVLTEAKGVTIEFFIKASLKKKGK